MTIKVSKNVTARAAELKNNLSFANGEIVANDDFYEKSLNGDLTIDTVKAVQKDRSEFVAAATLAAGEISEQAFSDDSELKTINFECQVGLDRVKVGFTREEDKLHTLSSYHATDIDSNIEKVENHLTSHFAKLIKG